MPTNRFTGDAALSRSGVSAGTIASRKGRASATPAPRRNVRRGMCSFLINIERPFVASAFRRTSSVLDRLCAHLKLRALHYTQKYRRKAVVVFRSVAHDGAQLGHVLVLDAAAERVGHHLLGHHPDELRRIAQQRRPQPGWPGGLLAVEERDGRVDRRPALAALLRPPLA